MLVRRGGRCFEKAGCKQERRLSMVAFAFVAFEVLGCKILQKFEGGLAGARVIDA